MIKRNIYGNNTCNCHLYKIYVRYVNLVYIECATTIALSLLVIETAMHLVHCDNYERRNYINALSVRIVSGI